MRLELLRRWLPWSGETEQRPELTQKHGSCHDSQGGKTKRSQKNMWGKREGNGTVRGMRQAT